MRDPAAFEALTDDLTARFAGSPGARGLILAGSTAEPSRRDRWSDHDFLAFVDEGTGEAARAQLGWLPDPHRILVVAREGGLGFSVLYDDGHLLEFAVAEASELPDLQLAEHRVAFGDAAFTSFVDERAAVVPPPADPANEVRLTYVKLLVGFGRARRGERVVAGQFVRGWAVRHLLTAVRLRLPHPAGGPDPFEPSRRLEVHHPAFASQLDHVLAAPVEDAARGVARLAREALEPGWDAFPSTAADAVIALLEEGR